MFHYATKAEIDKKNIKIAEYAAEAISKGYTPQQVQGMLWSKYGMSTTQVKDGKLILSGIYNGKGEKPFIFAEIG